MGGLLTHLGIAVAGFLIGIFLFKNWKYGLGFFIGHLIPDMIDFGFLGVIMGSVNPVEIMTHRWFDFLVSVGHTWWHWVVFGIVVFLIIFLLYKSKKLSKRRFKMFMITLIFFLAGVGVHLLIDKFVNETSYWI